MNFGQFTDTAKEKIMVTVDEKKEQLKQELKKRFSSLASSEDGKIKKEDLGKTMTACGANLTPAEETEMKNKAKGERVDFDEFSELMEDETVKQAT